MSFDTKIKVILREGLAPWQELNVCAFLMSGIAGTQGIVGLPYVDGSGVEYLPMSQQPILIHSANAGQLFELVRKASTRDDIACAIYTEELFDTYNDEDNRAEVAKHVTSDLNLVGVALWGKKNPVDRLTKGLPMHE